MFVRPHFPLLLIALITSREWIQATYPQPQPPCIGAPLELADTNNAAFIIGGMFPVHFFKKSNQTYKYNSPGLTWIQSMLFAIEEINQSKDLLPNITLGYRIFDSCNTIGIALEGALQMTSGISTQYIENGTCPCSAQFSRIIGLVGDAASATTTKVASLLSASKTPQISYSATSTDLSKKHLYPSFLRNIPPDNFQAILITDLMLQYKWRYINVVACDDLYGRIGVDELLPKLKENKICVAVLEVFDVKNDDEKKIKTVVHKLKKEREASVIVLWCQRPEALRVLQMAEREQLYYRTWIATETYGAAEELTKINQKVVGGMFGIIPTQNSYKPFEHELAKQTPNTAKYNPWLEEYWLETKNCKRTNSTVRKYECPVEHTDLTDLPRSKYVNVMDGVYAIAHALHNYITDNKNVSNGDFIDMKAFNGYVQKVRFIGKSNITVSFNKDGDPAQAMYSINNLQYDAGTNQSKHRRIADWNFALRNLTFTGVEIQYANETNTAPDSSCAEDCRPGWYGLRFGDKPCCWKCLKCPEGEIQPQQGKHSCIKCSSEKMSNNKRTVCIEPRLLYLNISDATGHVILAFLLTGYLVIIACLIIFLIKRKTPIVKASNRGLSLLQMISMMFQLAMPVFYFQSELSTELCASTLYYFIFFNTITISVTFTKADRLLKIFRASKNGVLAKHNRIKGNSVQYFKVCLLTFIGVIVCTIMYVIFKPKVTKEITSAVDQIDVVNFCGGHYDSILFSMVGYVVVISLVCCIYAFKARKLPQNYNEARFTSFAMFTFVVVWMMAVPIYFSRNNKVEKSASWCILNFLSTMVIFIPMYLPKVYVILFQPSKNTVARFRENLKQEAMNIYSKETMRKSQDWGTNSAPGTPQLSGESESTPNMSTRLTK